MMGKKLTLTTRYYRFFPAETDRGYRHEEYAADLERSAFLVIDVYGLGFDSNGAPPFHQPESSRPKEEQIVRAALLPALTAAREINMHVVYLNNSAPKIGLRSSEFGKVLHRQLGIDMETEFAEDRIDPREYHYGPSDHVKLSRQLSPHENEYFVRKHAYSGFVGTRLDLLLRYLDIKTLFTVGFYADACLFTTVAEALWHDYKVILLRDCTLAATEMPDERSDMLFTKRMIRLMETLYCVSVTAQDFIEATRRLTM